MSIITFIIGLLIFVYIGAPILIKFVQKMPAHPRFDPIDPMTFPESVQHYFLDNTRALTSLGFEVAAYISMPNASPNVKGYLVMLVNRLTGDQAMVTAMYTTATSPPRLSASYVEFSTRYSSGESVDTMNSSVLNAFKKPAHVTRTQVPMVQDVTQLYRIHQWAIAKAQPRGQKVVHQPGETIAFLGQVMIESYEGQAKFGRVFYDQKSDNYYPTWVGAFLMTWGLLWPMTAIRRSQMMSQARAVVNAFEAETGTHRMAAPSLTSGS